MAGFLNCKKHLFESFGQGQGNENPTVCYVYKVQGLVLCIQLQLLYNIVPVVLSVFRGGYNSQRVS